MREWAGVGRDFQFHVHQMRNLFADWGCNAGLVIKKIFKELIHFNPIVFLELGGPGTLPKPQSGAASPLPEDNGAVTLKKHYPTIILQTEDLKLNL